MRPKPTMTPEEEAAWVTLASRGELYEPQPISRLRFTAVMKRLRRWWVPRQLKPIPHGTPNGYSHRGCKCPACRAAINAYNRDWRAKRKAHR